jgi:hypothetical protein
MSSYKICTTLVGLADITTVLTGTQVEPFPAAFQDYAEIVGKDLTGAPIKAGLPKAKWHFDWLTRGDYAILKSYEGVCYIATNEGDDTYGNYKAVMAIPEEPELLQGHRVGPVEVEFWSLELQS